MTAIAKTPQAADADALSRRRALAAAISGAAALGMFCAPMSATADNAAPLSAQKEALVEPLPADDWALSSAFLTARVAALRNDMIGAARAYQRAARIEGQDLDLLENALLYSVIVGDVAEAAEAARTLRRDHGDNGLRLIVVVVDALAEGRFDDAQALLRDADAAREVPRFLQRLIAGWIEAGRGDVASARGVFLERQGDEPDIVDLLAAYHAAVLESAAGETETGVQALLGVAEIAREREPSIARNLRFTLSVAAALSQAGRVDEARAQLREAATPGRASTLIANALAQIDAGETLEAPFSTPREGVAEALYAYAGALAADENGRQGALAYVQMALHVQPGLEEARLLAGELQSVAAQHRAAAAEFARLDPSGVYGEAGALGQAAAYRRARDFEQALAALNAYASAVGAPGPRIEIERAGILQAMREFEQCAAIYGAALQEIEAQSGAFGQADWRELFGHAICLERSGRWDEAEARLRLSLTLNPDQPEVLNYLGYSLVEQRRDLDEALDLLRRAVQRRPSSGHIVDSLGWALYRLGRYDEAVVELERAAELEPTIAVINDHLGDALWKVGRRYEARFHWKRALSLEDEAAEVDRARVEDKLERGLDAVLDDELAATADPAPSGGGTAPSERDG